MFRTPVALVGLAGIFFVAGSFAPTYFTTAPHAQSGALSSLILSPNPIGSFKGDRLAGPGSASRPSTVSIVELVGVSQATVILRDRDGNVLYRSDPSSGVTTLARDTELPVVTLKDEMNGRAIQHPVNRQEGNEAPQEQKPKRRHPVGCVADVSPLVKASANRSPSLCIALLGQSLS